MDILEANFAHLIPRSPEGPFHKPDDEPGAPLIDARKDYLAEMTGASPTSIAAIRG